MSGKEPRDARQTVLDSAIKEFARKGFSGTSVQDILKATGLSKPTLYYYFESKAGLFRAILESAFDENLRRMQERVAKAKGAREQLIAVASAVFDLAVEQPELLRLVFGAAFAGMEEIPAECVAMEQRRRHFEYVQTVVEDGVKSGELDGRASARELTHGIYGAISHMARMHLLCDEGRLNARSAARVVDLFLDGARQR